MHLSAGILLYGFCLIGGAVLVVYGFALQSNNQKWPKSSGCTADGGLVQEEDLITLQRGDALGADDANHTAVVPNEVAEDMIVMGRHKVELSSSESSKLLRVLKAPLRVLGRGRYSKASSGLENPVPSGTVLDSKNMEKAAE